MMPAFSLTALNALRSLETTGSVSATAAELGVTQSAVSRAISGAEAACGLTLVQRGARPLRLTEEGRIVAQHAAEIATSLAGLKRRLSDARRNRAGTVRIGSFGASASTRILPALLHRFGARHPGIAVEVRETDDARALDDLTRDRVDIAVLADPGEAFDIHPVAEDRLVALMPAREALRGPVSPADLSDRPFIMTLGGSEPFITDWFRQGGVTPRITQRILQTHSILAMVGQGLGNAIVAGLSLPATLPGVVQVPLRRAPVRRIVLARRALTPRSAAAARFWEFATA